jgi:transmembrane sensor
MENSFNEIEELLAGYFSGDLSEEKRMIVDKWRQESPENEKLIQEMLYSWEAIPILKEMEQFNSFEALKKVNPRLPVNKRKWLFYIQRVAAVLAIPLMIYSIYITARNSSLNQIAETKSVIQTVGSRQGMVSHLILNDGTQVWLNSGATLQFPLQFTGEKRNVKLTGEAYFEVAKDEKHPFVLNAQKLNIEVLGTSFNVVSYDDESISEVVLASGKIKLFEQSDNKIKQFGYMHPGQKAVYSKASQKVITSEVDVNKYIAWRQGKLVFNDDPMGDVIKRLGHWYNVEIEVKDPEINNYIYTATFTNENLKQVLYLLKISAPIDYQLIERKALKNGEFSRQKVILTKKRMKTN